MSPYGKDTRTICTLLLEVAVVGAALCRDAHGLIASYRGVKPFYNPLPPTLSMNTNYFVALTWGRPGRNKTPLAGWARGENDNQVSIRYCFLGGRISSREGPTVSAEVAPRAPRGFSGLSVVSRLVCRSISELNSAPMSTVNAEI